MFSRSGVMCRYIEATVAGIIECYGESRSGDMRVKSKVKRSFSVAERDALWSPVYQRLRL